MTKYLGIAVGGSLGSLARWLVGSLVTARFAGSGFWVGTFVVNVTACVIIGFLLALFEQHTTFKLHWSYFFSVGFVGAYSTFSTMEWELFSGLRSGSYLLSASYLAASVFVGLLAIWVGTRLAGCF